MRDAKRVAHEALQQVRESIRVLRAPSPVLVLPTMEGAGTRMGWDRGQHRWIWLLPRGVELLPVLVYLALLMASFNWDIVDPRFYSWHGVVLTIAVLLVFVVDRLDYGFATQSPPAGSRTMVGILRLLLGSVLVAVAGWVPLWLLPLAPYGGQQWKEGGLPRLALFCTAVVIVVGLVGLRAGGVGAELSFNRYLLSGYAALLDVAVLLVVLSALWKTVLEERAQQRRAARALADLQAAHADLKRSAAQALAAAAARTHLAREIHDGVGHYLTAINVQLEKALAFRPLDPTIADQALRDVQRVTDEARAEVEGVMGAPAGLQSDLSLLPAFEQLVHHVRGVLAVDLQIAGCAEGYSRQAVVALYRTAQEALTNVQKHAQASTVRLHLALGEHVARLQISDDGRGFDPATPAVKRHEGTGGYGLQGMRERLEGVGGHLAIDSQPGHGTCLTIIVPKGPLGHVSSDGKHVCGERD
jgi:signal transduction histidine kinase